MNCTKIYTDDQGETHFEDISVELTASTVTQPVEPLLVSKPISLKDMVLFEAPDGWDYRWHTAPWRQYAVFVSGAFEIQVSDAEIRRFEAGDIVLLEDTSGKGHSTRALPGPTAGGTFVRVPE